MTHIMYIYFYVYSVYIFSSLVIFLVLSLILHTATDGSNVKVHEHLAKEHLTHRFYLIDHYLLHDIYTEFRIDVRIDAQ